jgi:hypothetical protein
MPSTHLNRAIWAAVGSEKLPQEYNRSVSGKEFAVVVIYRAPVLIAVLSLAGFLAPMRAADRFMFNLDVYSTPPGAHIYNEENGHDWGATKADHPVHQYLPSDTLPVEWHLAAKKPGYKPAHYTVKVLQQQCKNEGLGRDGVNYWQCGTRKVTMVLEPETK